MAMGTDMRLIADLSAENEGLKAQIEDLSLQKAALRRAVHNKREDYNTLKQSYDELSTLFQGLSSER